MREVQATEAKARLAELLRTVERGETITITRHGKTIAHLVPAHAAHRTQREDAINHFLRRRAGWERTGMSRDEILATRHDGHRW